MRLHLLGLPLLSLLALGACGGTNNDNATQAADQGSSGATDMAKVDEDQGNTSAQDMMNTSLPDMPSTTPDMTTGTPDDMGSPPDEGGMCVDVMVYQDGDGDGYGDGGEMVACLAPGDDAPDGFARQMGDCQDSDPLSYTGAEGVCNDNVDDDCDGKDEVCPASQPNQMSVPDWDCTGQPPANVYAWSRFDDGGGYFKDGGCFVFFEGKKDVFYSQRVNINPASDDCGSNGCVCPSMGGWPSYDRRLYAFTTSGAPDDCDEIALVDHAGEEQPVSNECRKYLYQLHRYDIPYSHVASSLDTLERRLNSFSTVEIACLEDAPHMNLPFKSLLVMAIERNDGFQKQ